MSLPNNSANRRRALFGVYYGADSLLRNEGAPRGGLREWCAPPAPPNPKDVPPRPTLTDRRPARATSRYYSKESKGRRATSIKANQYHTGVPIAAGEAAA